MASKQDRGTKRTCQNSECSARFYDLNRDPIVCPICGANYVIASSPVPIPQESEEEKARKAKKAELEKAESSEDKAEEEDTLEEVETDDSVDDSDDETFLEDEEEDGGDVSNIIGGAVSEEKDES